MSHNHYRIPLFELKDQLFDFAGGDGIERGAGLIHQQNLGFDGKRPGDAKALLLAAGKTGA